MRVSNLRLLLLRRVHILWPAAFLMEDADAAVGDALSVHLMLRHLLACLNLHRVRIALDELMAQPWVCGEWLEELRPCGREVVGRTPKVAPLLLVKARDLHHAPVCRSLSA